MTRMNADKIEDGLQKPESTKRRLALFLAAFVADLISYPRLSAQIRG
jgi:hypothetical protein